MAEAYSETQKRLTRESVFTALILLLDKHTFKELTITEIAKKAGVSRAAFYRNYDTKEDIIILYLNELFQDLLRQLAEPGISTKQAKTSLYFSFFKEHSQVIKILTRTDLTSLFYDQFCLYVSSFFSEHTDKLSRSPLHARYLPHYMASGLYRVLVEWVKNDTAESVENITEFMLEVMGDC